MLAKKLSMSLIIVVGFLFVGQSAMADMFYTLDEDFDLGTLDEVNHDPPNNNQLQLNITKTSFVFVNVAATARGTLVRIDAETGDILGEYYTAPAGRDRSPSRTAVDIKGNVWTANRDEVGLVDDVPAGSAVKIGIVIGGTRVSVDPETGEKKGALDGGYLQPPFDYNTCEDRNDDGLIRTTRGLDDVLPWGGAGDTVDGAEDECILLYQRLPEAEAAKHVSVDANDDVWVGGYPDSIPGFPAFGGRPGKFLKLNGGTAEIEEEESFDALTDFGCGGYGGQIDNAGILWSASRDQDELLRYDPSSKTGSCISVKQSFGLGIDTNGNIWNSMGTEQSIVKLDPSGALFDDFPKTTAPPDLRDQGVAVTPVDNHVWVAKGFGTVVSRLNNNGDIVEVVELGENGSDPTGIAVDANGKVWVTNRLSDTVMRISPGNGMPGDDDDDNNVASEVDLVVDLMNGSGPDNFGSMTGNVVNTETASQGTWTVIHDSGTPATVWDTITCNTEEEGNVPEGAFITVDARASDTGPIGDEQLEGDYTTVLINCASVAATELSPEDLSLTGQYIQIRATLEPNEEGDSPILSDLEVKSVEPEPEGKVCDVNADENIDILDILGIFFTIGDSAKQPFDPRDWDEDKTITIIDARGCVLECTNKYCAPEKKLY